MQAEAPQCYFPMQQQILRLIDVCVRASAQPPYGLIVVLLVKAQLDHGYSRESVNKLLHVSLVFRAEGEGFGGLLGGEQPQPVWAVVLRN